eukprot:5432712-Amphidinium_carterae.1
MGTGCAASSPVGLLQQAPHEVELAGWRRPWGGAGWSTAQVGRPRWGRTGRSLGMSRLWIPTRSQKIMKARVDHLEAPVHETQAVDWLVLPSLQQHAATR